MTMTESTALEDMTTSESSDAGAESAFESVTENSEDSLPGQAKAASDENQTPPKGDDAPNASGPVDSSVTPKSQSPSKKEAPAWVAKISDYHNHINGLLAGKENMKLVAVNVSARQPFYKKWSLEANQVMRLTASLRRRSQEAQEKYKV
jgi:hypothetical protein